MTYDEAIEWLLSFADFERSGRFQDRPDVAPMLALLERLGNPHMGRATVHIAGSKGKGSVAAMTDSILRAGGFYSGLYTSPHLYSYCERICVDGAVIPENEFARLVTEQLRPAVDLETELADRQLVTFDLLTALAFIAFAEHEARELVIETGLGGRVDSTNVFPTESVTVITPISLEHTQILGNTIEEIAREKAAIIKPSRAVVLAPQVYPEVEPIVSRFAAAADAPVVSVSDRYTWRKLSHDANSQTIRVEGASSIIQTRLPLLGSHQIENATTALASSREFDREITDHQIAEGLAGVRWPCRIEVLREDPLVIADGAHNRDSARRLAETLVEYFAADRALFVIGCGSDKDVDGLAEELAPLASRVLAVRADHPRAMAPKRIAEAFGQLNVDSEIVGKVPAAVDAAIAAAGPRALICVAGSLFVAAEARAHLLGVRNVS